MVTKAEIDDTVELFVAAGRRYIPVPLSEWREMMATRIGKAKVTTDKAGKTKLEPVDRAPVSKKIARKAKADRLEAAWTGKKSPLNDGLEDITDMGTDEMMLWCGRSVDEMSEDRLRETVRQMGAYIRKLEADRQTEARRTSEWMRQAAKKAKA